MKRKRNKRGSQRHAERLIARKIRQEQHDGFKCSHCKRWVVISQYMGTANRNHCNMCLWSKHVDIKKGDRKAGCQAGMKPIGLTFRIEDSTHRGEIMLIHDCMGCSKVSINRVAADDAEHQIMHVYETSLALGTGQRQALQTAGIYVAAEADRQEIQTQLFGLDTSGASS